MLVEDCPGTTVYKMSGYLDTAGNNVVTGRLSEVSFITISSTFYTTLEATLFTQHHIFVTLFT